MHPCEVFSEAVKYESYIREMTDDFSTVDTVANMNDTTPDIEEEGY